MSLQGFVLGAGALGVAGVVALFAVTWPRGSDAGDDPLLRPVPLSGVNAGARAGVQPATDSANPDAVQCAESLGITLEEAQERLKWQERLGDTPTRIAAVAPERHAGTWIEHEPTWALVVSFTGGPAGLDEAFRLAAAAEFPVRIAVDRATREAELLEAQMRASASLDLRQLAGLGSNPVKGEVLIHVLAGTDYARDPAALAERLEEEFGVPFSVEIVDSAGDDD